MTTRRRFVLSSVPLVVGLIATSEVTAAPLVRLTESDPLAVSLGYRHVAGQVDAKKYPTYRAGSNCANCTLFRATRGEPWAGCTALPGKLVSSRGWCMAWSKQA